MTVNDIYTYLDEKYDFSTALSYDNSGHLVGSLQNTVTGIVVCLDCTDETVTQAVEEGANLIISHHPVIFDSLKSVTDNSIVYRLIRNDISVISVHTNLDQADGGINEVLANIIGLENIEKVSDSEGFVYRIGETDEPIDADAFAKSVSEKLALPVKYVGKNTHIKRVAVCSGSGGSMLSEVAMLGVDAYVTADVKHHHFLMAYDNGISLYDAGHFNTEDVVTEPLKELLAKEFKETEFLTFHSKAIKFE